MKRTFEVSRLSGKTDAQVIFDCAESKKPGEILTYEELRAALQDGHPKRIGKARVYQAIASGNKKLLDVRKRYLRVVKGVGYKVLAAEEHMETALAKRETAQKFIQKGLAILKNTHMDELTPAQRQLHEGQILILGGFYRAMSESNRRHEKHDRQIEELRRRVEKLEA